ncbi:MAG: hypothetical protein KC615_18805 [Anaerolineae bacterium]|nr:hypothetical protein [Anaerolineae bacterium]
MTFDRREPKSIVDRERAMQHALVSIRQLWAGRAPDFEELGIADVDPEPLVIYDMNGQVLFYDFDIIGREQVLGVVRTSASRTIGTPVPSIQLGPRKWNPEEVKEAAHKKVLEEYGRAKILDTEFVCYSYPKIGIRVMVEIPRQGVGSLVYDVSDLSPVNLYDDSAGLGQTAWSFYQDIVEPTATQREAYWDRMDTELGAVIEGTPDILERSLGGRRDVVELRTAFEPKPLVEVLKPIPIPFVSSKVVRYSPHCYPQHECFELYGQITSVYCACATGEMILDWYRYYYDQSAIATAMGTGMYGTSISGIINGIESLSKNCLDVTWDSGPGFSTPGTAAWIDAKAEIDANRPLASVVPHHIRACAGWKRQNISIFPNPPKRWLKIYDPWPWNANPCQGGAIYWEDYALQTHWGFFYIRHRTTPCP